MAFCESAGVTQVTRVTPPPDEAEIFERAAALRTSRDFNVAIDSLRELAPTPAEFVSRFQRVSVSRIATASYMLREIEHAKRMAQEVTVDAPYRVHGEHVYPQTPVPSVPARVLFAGR